jgi:hypothetical protein
MTISTDVSGMAALTIVEALLLAMNDRNLLPEHEIMGILKDAASTHEEAANESNGVAPHAEVAALIHKIIAGGNSVRRT